MNYSKKLSTLIDDLKNILNEFGDMYVAIDSLENELTSTALDYEILPYDEGPLCCYPKNPYRDGHSEEWGFISKNRKDIGPLYLRLTCDSPDLIIGGDIVAGFKLPKTNYDENKEIDDNVLKEIEDLRDLFEKISRGNL